MTVKSRLITLICFAVFAVCSVGAIGLWAAAQEGAALREAVDVRLPSVLRLLKLSVKVIPRPRPAC